MTTVQDIATFILRVRGPMTTVKLQKLVYYAQAWNLAWTGAPLVDEEFEAWRDGPVCRALFNGHKGHRTISTHRPPEYRENLSDEACAVIYAILEKYGDLDGDRLTEMTHREAPWVAVRGDLRPDAFCDEVIPRGRIIEYFVTLEREHPEEAPSRPTEANVRRARFRRSKENVLRTHRELFEQLAK